jgi:hypothetical protein
MYFFAPFLFISIFFSEYQKTDEKNTDFSGFLRIICKKIHINSSKWNFLHEKNPEDP